MRIFKRGNQGIFYIQVRRGKSYSLKTTDKEEARKRLELLKKEYALIEIYRDVMTHYRKALDEINSHFSHIEELITNSQFSMPDGKRRGKKYISELEMQKDLVVDLAETFGLSDIKEQERFSVGIVDVLGKCNGKNIIVEFKLGTLRETYLGQCLRYLSGVKPDELWLIGESYDKSIKVFKDYPKIKLFDTRKYKKDGQGKIKRIIF